MRDFAKSVFINCPFDDGYVPLLRVLAFTLLSFGLKPRLALDDTNSVELRMAKILKLIEGCKYGIHDLSRCQATEAGEFFRLNMPFELGIDFACRKYMPGKSSKHILVLENAQYSVQKALSDFAGYDSVAHGNDALTLMKGLRRWMTPHLKLPLPAPQRLLAAFQDFMADLDAEIKRVGYCSEDIECFPIEETIAYMTEWLIKRAEVQ